MRISDWSSDVCSSDLCYVRPAHRRVQQRFDRHAGEDQDADHGDGVGNHRDERRSEPERAAQADGDVAVDGAWVRQVSRHRRVRSEEHTSELKSLMRISYAVFCLKKKPHFIATI